MGDDRFDSALKDTTFKKDVALTFKTFNADISAEPDYLPLVAATGVLLLKVNHITQLYL